MIVGDNKSEYVSTHL